MTIDVFLAGLMLICLESLGNCPSGEFNEFPNTAWVVNARFGHKPCGRKSPERNKLEVVFDEKLFRIEKKQGIKCEVVKGDTICFLGKLEDICFGGASGVPFKPPLAVPRLYDIDRRYAKWDEGRLKKRRYVRNRIHFAGGKISRGDWWPPSGTPTKWYTSDGARGPFSLSDRIAVAERC